jgi:hypothetical protein
VISPQVFSTVIIAKSLFCLLVSGKFNALPLNSLHFAGIGKGSTDCLKKYRHLAIHNDVAREDHSYGWLIRANPQILEEVDRFFGLNATLRQASDVIRSFDCEVNVLLETDMLHPLSLAHSLFFALQRDYVNWGRTHRRQNDLYLHISADRLTSNNPIRFHSA